MYARVPSRTQESIIVPTSCAIPSAHITGPPSQIVTLRDVIAHIKATASLDADHKRQLLSALSTLCRVLGADPVDVLANPPALRARMETVSFAAVGLSRTHWANVRSLTVAALNACGFKITPGKRKDIALSPAWQGRLRLLSGDRRLSCGLSRFVTYCSANDIDPDAVTSDTFATFNHALETNSLARNIPTIYRTASVCWNEAGQTIAGWPTCRVAVPSTSQDYSLPWDRFPAAFHTDVEAFLDKVANPDPFSDDYAKPVSPATVIGRRKQLRQMATALAASGFAPEEIVGLAVLVKPLHAEPILRFFLDRNDGKISEGIYNHALLLRTIARHWVKAPPADIEKLDAFCKRLTVKSHGLTPKNRARLRQFDEEENIGALLDLPSRLLRDTEQADDGGGHAATRVMYAVAIQTLIYTALRIKNLTAIELDGNLVRQRIGANNVVHLVIAGEEIKNGQPFEREMPKEYLELLDVYLKKYRPRLISNPSPFLFPNAQGSQRSAVAFGRQIGKLILVETGIRMHVHLFRHMTVKLHLEAHPNAIETARQLLGHKDVRTTTRTYADLQTAAAHARHDAVLAGLSEQSRRKPGKPRKEPRS